MWWRKKKDKTTPMTAETDGGLGQKLKSLFRRSAIDGAFLADLEETLLTADVGVTTCERLINAVKTARTPDQARDVMRDEMNKLFFDCHSRPNNVIPAKAGIQACHSREGGNPGVEVPGSPIKTLGDDKQSGDDNQGEETPRIVLVLGVNGVGKTTTIAKLAHKFKGEGKKVLLVAGDTFRAAAIEQLGIWGERLGCDVVAQKIGADSAAVAFDAVERAKAKGYDIVLIDTAGRMHTKQYLMEELKKIDRVIGKAYPGAPHDRWLVIDATVGQNGLNQASEFHKALGLTGIIVAKLDGTAKGGIICAVAELGVPILSIGVGESLEDLLPFDAKAFTASIISEDS